MVPLLTLYHRIEHQSPSQSDSRKLTHGTLQLWRDTTQQTVLLTQNYRATDPSVFSIFDRVRYGKTTAADIEVLRQRTFGRPLGPDLSDEKWQSATLVTPRNAVRQAWNNQAALRHSLQTGNQIYICPSLDEELHAVKDTMISRFQAHTERTFRIILNF
jgi:hypothetical protein